MAKVAAGIGRNLRGLRLATVAALLAGLASGTAEAQTGCSVLQQNLFVRDVMSDIYLWQTTLPPLNPARYASPEEYLEALRYRPLDTSFSYITSRAASDALLSNSEYAGFGFSTAWRGDSLLISQVFPGSPADENGLRRGDVIVDVNGRTIADLVAAGVDADLFGPAEAGVAATVAFRRGDTVRTASMVKRAVVIPTVSDARVIDVDGRKVGYIFFRNFVQPSVDALDVAFDALRRDGATELVLDVRYNGGGLVAVAQHLGGLIGGALTNGQVFAEYAHNDRNAFRNRALRFEASDHAWRLNRVFVVTSQLSASASELVINALRPFMPVILIGDRTYGKPVGQYVIPFCDKIIAPVSFSLRNAAGEGDYFDGLQPTCPASDDLSVPIGDPAESSLAEAIHFIRYGVCSGASVGLRAARTAGGSARRAVGWQSVLGAH